LQRAPSLGKYPNMKVVVIQSLKWTVLRIGVLLIANTLAAQDTGPALSICRTSRWSAHVDLGLNSFQTKGIPMSRNQMNFNTLHPDSLSRYDQESKTAGLCYEVAVSYQLFDKGKIGLLLNGFKDDPEYMNGDRTDNNVESIISDSMSKVSIANMQSYLNLGLNYEHQLYQSPSMRHLFHASLAAGISFNRTPDRTEYDVFDTTHFVMKESQSSSDLRITHTDFRSGVFIAPSMNYSLRIGKNHFFRVTLSQYLQSNATEEGLKILNKNSSGSGERRNYSLSAFQIKIGYAF
jgi:hypothetical protein